MSLGRDCRTSTSPHWALDDSGEADLDDVRAIRDESEARVTGLFGELAAE